MGHLALGVGMGQGWVVPLLIGPRDFKLWLLIWLGGILILLGHPYVVYLKDPGPTFLHITYSLILATTLTMPNASPPLLFLAHALSP